MNSFTCIMMLSIWIKALAAIDLRNKALQGINTTLDVEVDNIDSLLKELLFLLVEQKQLQMKLECLQSFRRSINQSEGVFFDERELHVNDKRR